MQDKSMISLAGVTKVFFTDDLETHALDGIHLDVAKGEFLSISGPSGCGKSTLLAILGLLDTPTEGKYALDGYEVATLPPAARAKVRNERIGFIFQAFNLIGDLTVLQNVELPLTYRQAMTADERRKAALHALAGVHFDIGRGEYVSISGPSGCGKSTLLAILGLLDTPSDGAYRLNGREVADIGASERAQIRNKEIGFVFQAFNLIGDLTVFENVELPLTYREGVSKAERRERTIAALERVGMAHRVKHFPAQLSGGQQQRVAVARALVGQPSILLADEPTGNLDSKNGEAVMQLLDELHKQGSTICMVTHDPRYADFAQRKIFMFDGRVVDEETMHRLRHEEDQRLMRPPRATA